MITNTIVFTNGDTSIAGPLTTSWTAANGSLVTVTTYKDSAGQSNTDRAANHNRHYATMWAAFPP